MTLLWTCWRCGLTIRDEEPHTDPESGEDVHERCCVSCHPDLAPFYGITLDVSTAELEHAAAGRPGADQAPRILGHGGGLTNDQTARAQGTAT